MQCKELVRYQMKRIEWSVKVGGDVSTTRHELLYLKWSASYTLHPANARVIIFAQVKDTDKSSYMLTDQGSAPQHGMGKGPKDISLLGQRQAANRP